MKNAICLDEKCTCKDGLVVNIFKQCEHGKKVTQLTQERKWYIKICTNNLRWRKKQFPAVRFDGSLKVPAHNYQTYM